MIKIGKYDFELEDKYVNDDELGRTALYFIGPKEMLEKEYPDAESTEILIEFLTHNRDFTKMIIAISPTKDGSDYDWNDYHLEREEIEKLIVYGLEEDNDDL